MPSPWRTHLAILAATALATAGALLRPAWLLANPLPCLTRVLFHINCPFCGMTHDLVSILHHQRPAQNPASWLAAVVIYLLYPALLLWAWLRRRPEIFHHPLLRRAVLCAVLLLWFANNLPR